MAFNTCSRGLFIVIEGVDKVGKTTQVSLLAEYFKTIHQKDVICMHFPDRTTPIGSLINDFLQQKKDISARAIQLMFAANRWERASEIVDALAAGITVIADRYSYSGIAYSAANGLPIEWCVAQEVGLPAPDIVIYLDNDDSSDNICCREGFGDERYEHIEFQNDVCKQFRDIGTLLAANGWPPMIHLNVSNKSINECSESIKMLLMDKTTHFEQQSLGGLQSNPKRGQ